MEEGDVSYETLQEMLRLERRSNKLTPLPNGFWASLQAFLKEIEDAFTEAQAKDPFARKVMMMTDRVKNARHAAEAVWTLRERKIAMLALAHVRQPGPTDGMTKTEKDLHNAMVEQLLAGRRTVFEGTAAAQDYARKAIEVPSAPPARVDPKQEPVAPPEALEVELPTEDEPVEVPEQEERPPVAVPSDTPTADSVTIRATGPIPPFVGPDMQTYLLDEGDVASVPKSIADLLVKRKKAAIVPVNA